MFQTTSEPSWYAAYSSSSAQYAEKQSTFGKGSPPRDRRSRIRRVSLKYPAVAGASPVPVQIWQGWAQCADVAEMADGGPYGDAGRSVLPRELQRDDHRVLFEVVQVARLQRDYRRPRPRRHPSAPQEATLRRRRPKAAFRRIGDASAGDSSPTANRIIRHGPTDGARGEYRYIHVYTYIQIYT